MRQLTSDQNFWDDNQAASKQLKKISILEKEIALRYLKTQNFWVCGFDKDGTNDFTVDKALSEVITNYKKNNFEKK